MVLDKTSKYVYRYICTHVYTLFVHCGCFMQTPSCIDRMIFISTRNTHFYTHYLWLQMSRIDIYASTSNQYMYIQHSHPQFCQQLHQNGGENLGGMII